MGKSLIVKGADFSLNGLDSTWHEATVSQGLIVTNNSSESYGKFYTTGTTSPNSILSKVFIPAGATMAVKVTNNDVQVTDLLTAYVAATQNAPIVDRDTVSGIVANLHPFTNSIREADGSFQIENTTANDLYYYICFGYDITSGPAISVTGKKCLYQRVMTE